MKVLTASYQQLLFYAQLGQATMDLSLLELKRSMRNRRQFTEERDLMVSRERGSEISDRQGEYGGGPHKQELGEGKRRGAKAARISTEGLLNKRRHGEMHACNAQMCNSLWFSTMGRRTTCL
jgi:hypothetical protein